MQRSLGITVVVLALMVAAFWGWRWLSQPRISTPAELAVAAVTAAKPLEREKAAVSLSAYSAPTQEQRQIVVEKLVDVLEQSRDPQVKAACVRGLDQNWDYRNMPKLLDLLSDDSYQVRLQAGASVERLLRCRYGFQADAPVEQRQAVIKRLRDLWEDRKQSPAFQLWMRQQMGGDL